MKRTDKISEIPTTSTNFIVDWQLTVDKTDSKPSKWEEIKNFNKMNELYPPIMIEKE